MSIPAVRLGRSELHVAPLGWGMWRFAGDDLNAARARIDAALEIGCTLFDTADIYGPDNGEPFGAAEALLGRLFGADRALRARMILASKGGIAPPTPYNASADYLVAACEASLTRLRTDRLDLYQIHRPDLLAHPAEVAAALDRLRTAGKIREAGVSNYTAAQTRALMAHLPFPLASIQPEFSPLANAALEDGVLDIAVEAELGVLAWSPLAQGRLGGAGDDAAARRTIAVLDVIAAREQAPRAAVAYAWIAMHPARPVVLIGAQTPARIREAAQALRITLTREDWYAVLVAARGAAMP